LYEELTPIDDIAAGEIVKLEVELDGKKTGVFIAVRVVVNNDEIVQFNPLDLPRAILKQNWEAISQLLQITDAGLNSREEI
jgi:hypothetical protein